MASEILAIGIPTLAVLIGVLINNSRMSDMRSNMDARFNALEHVFTEKLLRVEQVMNARLKHLEENR